MPFPRDDNSLEVLLNNLSCDIVGKICSFLDVDDFETLFFLSKKINACLIASRPHILAQRDPATFDVLSKFIEFSQYKEYHSPSYRWPRPLCVDWQKNHKEEIEKDVVPGSDVTYVEELVGGRRNSHTLRRDRDLITSLKVKGKFKYLDILMGGQSMTRFLGGTQELHGTDGEGYVDLLPTTLRFIPLICLQYHDVRIMTDIDDSAANVHLKITGVQIQNRVHWAMLHQEYVIKQIRWHEKFAFGKSMGTAGDTIQLSLNCYHDSVNFVVVLHKGGSTKNDLVKSFSLTLDDKTTHTVRGSSCRAETICKKELYNHQLPLNSCYYLPVKNLNFSRVDKAVLTIALKKPSADVSGEIYYTNLNMMRYMSGMCGLALSS